MNSAFGAIGNTVTLIPAEEIASADLSNLKSSTIDTLVILGGNPVYNLGSLPNAKAVVRLGYYEDETSEKANWNFPWHIFSNLGTMRLQLMTRSF